MMKGMSWPDCHGGWLAIVWLQDRTYPRACPRVVAWDAVPVPIKDFLIMKIRLLVVLILKIQPMLMNSMQYLQCRR